MADNMPADHVPAVNLPSANVSAEQVPAENVPVEQVPAENVPAEQVRNSGVFPPEIWKMIIPYVDKEDFRSLKLSCTLLHDLCDHPSVCWKKVSSFNIIILMCHNCNEQLLERKPALQCPCQPE